MENNIPWVEKYRPINTKSIVLDSKNTKIIKNIIKYKYFPNLLLYGPPGTGKTTTIINLINEYQMHHYGKINKYAVIHLNASDERGIDVIRTKIYNYIKTKTFNDVGNKKFIVLDEVDYMTSSAQKALKFIVENEKCETIFVLICNYISKINIELQNIFLNIRFNDLPECKIKKLLEKITKKEKLNISTEKINEIQEYFRSDIRSMVNYIQCNHTNLCDMINSTIDIVYKTMLSLKNTDNSFNYLCEIAHKHRTSVRDIFNNIIKHFLLLHINKLNATHFIFFKSYYHDNLNFETITKTLIDIIYIYI